VFGDNLTELGQQLLAEWERREAVRMDRDAAIWNRLNNSAHDHTKAAWY